MLREVIEHVALWTKPSTIQVIGFTGKAETFVLRTARHEELGDYIFIECVDDSGVKRIALPPKAARAIASQAAASVSAAAPSPAVL